MKGSKSVEQGAVYIQQTGNDNMHNPPILFYCEVTHVKIACHHPLPSFHIALPSLHL